MVWQYLNSSYWELLQHMWSCTVPRLPAISWHNDRASEWQTEICTSLFLSVWVKCLTLFLCTASCIYSYICLDLLLINSTAKGEISLLLPMAPLLFLQPQKWTYIRNKYYIVLPELVTHFVCCFQNKTKQNQPQISEWICIVKIQGKQMKNPQEKTPSNSFKGKNQTWNVVRVNVLFYPPGKGNPPNKAVGYLAYTTYRNHIIYRYIHTRAHVHAPLCKYW